MRVLLLSTALASLSPIAASAANVTVTGYDTPDPEAFEPARSTVTTITMAPSSCTLAGRYHCLLYDLQHELQTWAMGLMGFAGTAGSKLLKRRQTALHCAAGAGVLSARPDASAASADIGAG